MTAQERIHFNTWLIEQKGEITAWMTWVGALEWRNATVDSEQSRAAFDAWHSKARARGFVSLYEAWAAAVWWAKDTAV